MFINKVSVYTIFMRTIRMISDGEGTLLHLHTLHLRTLTLASQHTEVCVR